METTGQINRRVIIFSLGAVIVPLVVFPARLGTDIARASLINALYELVYYSVVLFIFHRRTTLLRLVQGAGVCLIYRMGLGAVFGLLVAAAYSMQVRLSLTLGMSGYMPAILFHIALAPFVLKPVIDVFYAGGEGRRHFTPAAPLPSGRLETARSPLVAPRVKPAEREESGVPAFAAPRRPDGVAQHRTFEHSASSANRDLNGFDRAVYYLGEHTAVQLAAVVDNEGLTLGAFRRGQIQPEDWAPLALLLIDENHRVLWRGQVDGLEKIDLLLRDKRLVVAHPDGYHLMVLADRHDDDLLNIRINQALDMISKYVAERYGSKIHPNAERVHVPSA